MSMPQPIFVALIGSSADIVRRAKRHFRLEAPGIGPAYVASLATLRAEDVPPLSQIPVNQIALWIALDDTSFSAAQLRHRSDLNNPRYSRGFYSEHFPEPCILIDFDRSPAESGKQLTELAQQIIAAWYETS